MVASFTTVGIPLISGLGGGLGAGLLVAVVNSRTQRNQHLREQMLAAADEFTVAFVQSDFELRDALSRSSAERLEVSDASVIRTRTLLSRVQLLFHPNSRAALEASDATEGLMRAMYAARNAAAQAEREALEEWPRRDALDFLRSGENALDPTIRAFWTALSRPRRHWHQPAATTAQRGAAAAQRLRLLEVEVELVGLRAEAEEAREAEGKEP